LEKEIITLIDQLKLPASVGVSSVAIAKFLGRISGGAFDEVRLMFGEKARMWRFKNELMSVSKAIEMTIDAGLEPKEIPFKTLFPLLEGMSFEDDPVLSTKWAALLANASTSLSKGEIHPSFPKMLSQLSSTDVKILDWLYAEYFSERREDIVVSSAEIIENLEITVSLFELAAPTLMRLNLSKGFDEGKYLPNQEWLEPGALCLTKLGLRFVAACREPKEIIPSLSEEKRRSVLIKEHIRDERIRSKETRQVMKEIDSRERRLMRFQGL